MLSWLLRYRLARMSRRARPDRVFVLSLAETLRERGYFPARRLGMSRWKTATVTLGVVLSFVVGTSSYAYVADEVVPGHPLYPVRTNLERVELRLARASGQAERVRLRQAKRRIKEARVLAGRHQPLPPLHAKLVKEQAVRDKKFFAKNGNVIFLDSGLVSSIVAADVTSTIEVATSTPLIVSPSRAEPSSSQDENSDQERSARHPRNPHRLNFFHRRLNDERP